MQDPSPRGGVDGAVGVIDGSPADEDVMEQIYAMTIEPKPPMKILDPSPRGYEFPNELIRDPWGDSPMHMNERGPIALRVWYTIRTGSSTFLQRRGVQVRYVHIAR